MRPGDPFPSVRLLSKELKINPNTAHKVIGQLVVGTVVAAQAQSSASDRSRLLKGQLEGLVVEAKKLGLEMDDVVEALSAHWRRLGN
jgi:GntR family transcriptional regulator